MAKLNVATRPLPNRTHEGAPAPAIDAEAQLRRSVLSCLLWESEFYEDGESIADRIREFAHRVHPETLAALAVEARSQFNLRHAPLLLARELCRHPDATGAMIGDTVADVIQRADELAEFVAIYWKDGRQPLSAQAKKGLARAFTKFDAYRLAKYDRPGHIRLRDVLFLSHAKPETDEQAATWAKLIDGTLESPDTWEVALSGGADKRETFERLIREGQLGYLALLRNLRNMEQAGVDESLVVDAILARKGARRILPFRFVAAARAAMRFEVALDEAMQAALGDFERLEGTTAVLVDVSGSMGWALSGRSQLNRMDAASALATFVTGVADRARVFTFSNQVVEVPPRHGMALIDAIKGSQPYGGTYLGRAVALVNEQVPHDRLIVVTDEQSHDRVPGPKGRGYLINVASARNGVGYGPWVHIDGFSEQVIRFVQEYER